LEELVVRQRLSRAIEAYKTPSPAARAALQLQAQGRQFAPGQSLEFLFVRNTSGVHAWELEEALDSGKLDTKRYYKLLDRAIQTVLDPCKPLLVPQRLL
jgi:DNA polymerase elongation subunit (family B)